MSILDDFPQLHDYAVAAHHDHASPSPSSYPAGPSAFEIWYSTQTFIDPLCAILGIFTLVSATVMTLLLVFGVMDWKGNLYLDSHARHRNLVRWRPIEHGGLGDGRSYADMFLGRPVEPGGISEEERRAMAERLRLYNAASREDRRWMEFDVISDRLRRAGYF